MAAQVMYIIVSILLLVVGLSILLYGPIVSGYIIQSAIPMQSELNNSELNDTISNIVTTTWQVYTMVGSVFIFIAIGLMLTGLVGGFAPAIQMIRKGFGY